VLQKKKKKKKKRKKRETPLPLGRVHLSLLQRKVERSEVL
jgi:hypothetical protein